MAESIQLAAKKREGRGTRQARHLRKEGLVPAVVNGHKEQTVSLTLTADDLHYVLRHGARVVDLQTDGAVQKALIRDLQWDHLGKEVLHVDFERVSADERIQIPVRIELRGIAPGVTGGGLLDQPLHTLQVECPVVAVPESIRVNISELQIGGAIHVKDVVLPEGVTALGDPEAIVVHVTAPVAEPEAPAVAAPAPGAAEPEVIGRKAEEEEAEK